MFTTLYGEKSITDDKHPEKTFSDNWKKYGFQIDSNSISLISIAIYDPDSDAMFVGHTGAVSYTHLSCYKDNPQDSWKQLVDYMHAMYPAATDKQIRKILK